MFIERFKNQDNEPTTEVPVILDVTNEAAKVAGRDGTTKTLKSAILCEGFDFSGKIRSAGMLNLDGTFRGEIAVSELIIGPNGKVFGSVQCQTLTVRGAFEGDAQCDQLILGGSSVVNADIHYRGLQVASGAIVSGELRLIDDNAPPDERAGQVRTARAPRGRKPSADPLHPTGSTESSP